jgi:pyrimidine-nucleoside phosphorylase
MLPQWIIEKKRNGQPLSDEEIRFFIDGYVHERIPDYQMAALAMAIYFKGMTFPEITTLTDAMMRSGDLVDTSGLKNFKVDKHSTGGIGDKVSLILAPLVACFDLAVPMISGRGLGITGGTLDKLESIPGYRTDLSEREFLAVVEKCGCSITGQTGRLAPADKKLYALRDVTATVPSIPLIVSSIMCKKLAEGIDALVLDVKFGRGAFMQTIEEARELAGAMVQVGKLSGKSVAALITDMNQPLGHCVGNALEVRESIEILQGKNVPDLLEVTLGLAAEMLVLGKKAGSRKEAHSLLMKKIDTGDAFLLFREMVKLQGGDVRAVDDITRLPSASFTREFNASRAGYVTDVNPDLIGRAAIVLGAGRTLTADAIDPSVGFSDLVKVGDRVEEGSPLLKVHANRLESIQSSIELLQGAFSIGSQRTETRSMIIERHE